MDTICNIFNQVRFIVIILLLYVTSTTLVANKNTSTYNVLDFGAVPDGETCCTEAFQKTIDDCHLAGGCKVFIPTDSFSFRVLPIKDVGLQPIGKSQVLPIKYVVLRTTYRD